MLRRTLLSSLLQTALLGAAGGIGFAPGKAAARNNARSAPVEECEADLVIVGSGAAGLSAGLAALEAGEADKAAAAKVEETINALPAADALTLADKEAVLAY